MTTHKKPTNHRHEHGPAGPADRSVWQVIRQELERAAPDCGLNMAHAAVVRHARSADHHRPALRWIGADGTCREWTYGALDRDTNRLANGFCTLGLVPGQVVASLCGRLPELYLTALATLKAGGIFCALYPDYGPGPILHRLAASRAAALVTTRHQYAKIHAFRSQLPDLARVLVIDAPADEAPVPGVIPLHPLMDTAAGDFTVPPTDPESPALLHFTSGTTGMPKGVVHVHAAALHHILTGRRVLDLTPGDVYWCTADPGWVTGVVYGFLAPLMAGTTAIVDAAAFDAGRWLRILAGQRVSIWYTSPSALRRLMTLPAGTVDGHDLSALRLAFSVGEPLPAAAVRWGEKVLGVPIRDTWWQTETGGIVIATHAAEPVCPGAMGRAVDGILAEVRRPDGEGSGEVAGDAAGEVGELVLAAGWPSMFRHLIGNPDAYRKRFTDGWYRSGDLVRRDRDGIYWFVGRIDDMIKTAGHMVSPFEVESVLLAHPAVSEAAVVGLPDPHIGQRVTAHLCLRPGAAPCAALRGRIMAFARQRLGPALAPREIVFTRSLPKNQAGKIVRRELIGSAIHDPFMGGRS